MATWRRILGVLRKSAEGGDPLSDAELLGRFVASRDQAAFELLVWRHSAMVFGVCRRALRDEHLAEDAFQAVFLVLARKAASVRGSNIAGWLFRITRRAASRAAKRITPVAIATDRAADPLPDPLERDELHALLDTEISRLPERLRRPVLLCYLGGLSTDDAAQQLGIPRGTVLSRLATARKRLVERLTRRGVTVPAGLIAVAAQPAKSVVSAAVRAAGAFAAPVAPLPHSFGRPAILAEGVIRAMSVTKFVPVAGVFLVVTGLVTGFGFGPGSAPAPASAQQGEKAAPPTVAQKTAKADLKDQEAPARKVVRDTLLMHIARLQEGIASEQRIRERQLKFNNLESAAETVTEREVGRIDAELFSVRRKLIEQQVAALRLERKLKAGTFPTDDAKLSQAIASDTRVVEAVNKLAGAELALMQAKATSKSPDSPSIVSLTKRVEELTKELATVRKEARGEAEAALHKQSKQALELRLADAQDELETTREVLSFLEKDRDLRVARATEARRRLADIEENHQSMIAPKQQELRKLQAPLAVLDGGKAEAQSVGTPASLEEKLDKLIHEVEGLRRDVQELKRK